MAIVEPPIRTETTCEKNIFELRNVSFHHGPKIMGEPWFHFNTIYSGCMSRKQLINSYQR